MEKINATTLIVAIIGGLTIVISIVKWLLGNPFKDQILFLFIGISLLGTAWIQHTELSKQQNKD